MQHKHLAKLEALEKASGIRKPRAPYQSIKVAQQKAMGIRKDALWYLPSGTVKITADEALQRCAASKQVWRQSGFGGEFAEYGVNGERKATGLKCPTLQLLIDTQRKDV
jgi:hypothetical protein